MSSYNKQSNKRMKKMNTYVKHLSQPWFNYIKNGDKTLEGRLNRQDWSKMKKGDILIFTNKNEKIITSIKSINSYVSFEQLLYEKMDGVTMNLKRLLPNIETIDEGIQIYENIYENNIKTKVLCIDFDIIE